MQSEVCGKSQVESKVSAAELAGSHTLQTQLAGLHASQAHTLTAPGVVVPVSMADSSPDRCSLRASISSSTPAQAI